MTDLYADDRALAVFGKKVSEVWADLENAAIDEMQTDGHEAEKIRTEPFLMMRYTGQLEDVEVRPSLRRMTGAVDMRRINAEFEAVYAKINHRVSRYGAAGFSIMELGITAIADKVKPTLERRSLGSIDPAAAHKGKRRDYIGGQWHEADLYEMDRLEPGHEVKGPAIIEHPATTLVVHPRDSVAVDEWTLLHYRYG